MLAGTLEIQMLADTAKLIAGMNDAERAVNRAMGKIIGYAEAAQKALATLGVGLSGAAFASFINHAIEAADHLNKLSQRAGIATDQLSRLQFAAKLSDVSTDSLSTAIKKLNVSVSEGLGGDQQKIAIFKSLGISLKDASGHAKSADKVLLELSDVFGGATDGANKTAYAVALMGKAGDEMIPLLNGGSAALQETMNKADRLGLTISKEFGQKAEEFNDNLTIIESSSHKLAVQLGGELVSALGDAMSAFAKATEEGGKMKGFKAFFDRLGNDLLGWEQHAFEKQRSSLQRDIQDLTAQLNAPVADMFGQMDSIKQRLQQKQAEMQKLLQDYFKFSSAAGGGRGFVNPPVLKAKVDLAPPSKAAVDESIKAFEAVIAKVNEFTAAEQAESQQDTKLTAGQKLALGILVQLRDGRLKLTEAQTAALGVTLELALRTEAEADAHKANLQAMEEMRKARADYVATLEKDLDAGRKAIEAQDEQNAKIGLTARQIAELDAAKHDAAAASLDLLAADAAAWDGEYQLYAKLAQQQRDLAAKIRDGAAQQEAVDNFRSMWSSIDRTAHDVFVNIFEGGSNVFKKLGQTLKASLLDLLYQMTVRPFIMNIVANVMGNGFAGGIANAAGSGISSMFGSTLMSGAGRMFGLGGGAGMSFGNMAGTAYANMTGTGIDGLLATNGAYGTAGGGAGAFGGLASTGIGAAIAAGMAMDNNLWKAGYRVNDWGQAAQTVVSPVGSGSGLIDMFLQKLGISSQLASILTGSALSVAALSLLGVQKPGGPKSESGYGALDVGRGDSAYATQIAQGIQASYAAIASTLGVVDTTIQNLGVWVAQDPRGTAMTQLQIQGGSFQRATDQASLENVGRSDADLQAAVAQASTQMVVKLLQDSAQGAVGEYLRSINIASASLEDMQHALAVAQNVGTFDKAMQALGPTFSGLQGMSVEAKDALLTASGGVAALVGNLGALFSESEKQQMAWDALKKSIADAGVQVPASVEAYRTALAAAMQDETDAGKRATAVLLQNAQAFAQLSPVMQDAAQQAGALDDAISALRNPVRSIDDIAQSIVGLQDQGQQLLVDLMRAQGDAGAGGAQRFLDTQGMTDEEIALYDLIKARQNEIATIQQQQAHDQQVASTRQQLQDQIWQAEGNTAALRAEELAALAALDPSLASMQQHLYDLQDAAKAAEQTLAENNALLDAVSRTRNSLVSAYQREANALQQAIDQARQFADSMRDLKQSLLVDQSMSALVPRARYNAARNNLDQLGQAALAGDHNAQAQIQQAVQAFLQASRLMYGSGVAYTNDFQMVQSLLDQLGASSDARADVAAQQLAAAQSQLDRLQAIDANTQTIAQALDAYTAAIIAAINAGLTPDNPLNIHIPGHAGGGWHSGGWSWVGEQGPELRYMPASRIFSANDSRNMVGAANDELIAEVRQLRAEVVALNESNIAGHAMNAGATRQSAQEIGGAVERGVRANDLKKKSAVV